MTRLLWAAAVFLLWATALPAEAQYAAPSPALQVPLPPAAPPPGVLSSTTTIVGVDANGDSVKSRATTFRDPNGVATMQKTTTTIVPPPSAPVVTRTTTTHTSTTTTPGD